MAKPETTVQADAIQIFHLHPSADVPAGAVGLLLCVPYGGLIAAAQVEHDRARACGCKPEPVGVVAAFGNRAGVEQFAAGLRELAAQLWPGPFEFDGSLAGVPMPDGDFQMLADKPPP